MLLRELLNSLRSGNIYASMNWTIICLCNGMVPLVPSHSKFLYLIRLQVMLGLLSCQLNNFRPQRLPCSCSYGLLTHWGWIMHICICRLYHHWCNLWFVAHSVPSHYLNHCWIIVNLTLGNKLKWNFYQNITVFIQENAYLKMLFANWQPFFLGLNVLKQMARHETCNLPINLQSWSQNLWRQVLAVTISSCCIS